MVTVHRADSAQTLRETDSCHQSHRSSQSYKPYKPYEKGEAAPNFLVFTVRLVLMGTVSGNFFSACVDILGSQSGILLLEDQQGMQLPGQFAWCALGSWQIKAQMWLLLLQHSLLPRPWNLATVESQREVATIQPTDTAPREDVDVVERK